MSRSNLVFLLAFLFSTAIAHKCTWEKYHDKKLEPKEAVVPEDNLFFSISDYTGTHSMTMRRPGDKFMPNLTQVLAICLPGRKADPDNHLLHNRACILMLPLTPESPETAAQLNENVKKSILEKDCYEAEYRAELKKPQPQRKNSDGIELACVGAA